MLYVISSVSGKPEVKRIKFHILTALNTGLEKPVSFFELEG
jgi:hypothetical protein